MGAVRGAGTLPADVSSFVGRRQEVSEAKHLLSRSRLLTLTGSGGIGKTRLALRMAAEVRRSFPGGVWLVELAALDDGELLAQTVASQLRLGNESIGEPVDALVDFLAEERLLLILDNCEHLLDPCAALANTLLAAAPELHVLATSRQTLGVTGECVFPVPPLSLHDPDRVPAAESAKSEAVRLFADRAASVRRDFVLTAENTGVIAQICHRLDGIPLAIELAAARLRSLSAEEILGRLDDRLDLLTGGSRAALPRQRTLRAMIQWSFDLCSAEERRLWSRLSVFFDGCDLEAAEEVCSGEGIERRDVLDLIRGLVDKSILACEERGSRMRYWLRETVRQYGAEQLAASDGLPALRERHRDWFLRLAERAEADWFGPGQLEWFARLRLEHPNLRAALEYCMSEPGQGRTGLSMAASMWSHRLGFGSLGEGRRWLGQGLALDLDPNPVRAKALYVDGVLALLRGDRVSAAGRLEQFRNEAQQLGEDPGLERAGVTLAGLLALFQSDFPDARTLLEDALTRHRAADDPGSAAVVAFMLATACFNLGDPAAGTHAQRCLALCTAHHAQWSGTHALWATSLENYRNGLTSRAATHVRQALRDKPLSHDQWGIAQCLEVLGWCAAVQGRGERAATLLGAAGSTWRLAGSALSGFGHLHAGHEQCETRLRDELGEKGFTTAFDEGAQLTLEQAVTFALEVKRNAVPPPPVQEASAPLTRREQQVSELVAQGLSNKEIAARLVISQRTAEGHVEHILTKLGFTSRAQIARWATRSENG